MKQLYGIFFIAISLGLNAQRFQFKGAGFYGAGLTSSHRYQNKERDLKVDTVFVDRYYYPQNHVSKEFINWGAGIFAEFSTRNDIRWQTELEYANKGAREMEIVDRYMGTRSGSYGLNKYTYFQWNNYVKVFNPLGIGQWYWMAGVRLEYLFRKNATVFTPYSNQLKPFWFSGDIGAGYEMRLLKKFNIFIEGHWNPDVIPTKIDQVRIRNRTFEVRVGLVYRKRKKGVDDCTAPVYKGPAY